MDAATVVVAVWPGTKCAPLPSRLTRIPMSLRTFGRLPVLRTLVMVTFEVPAGRKRPMLGLSLIVRSRNVELLPAQTTALFPLDQRGHLNRELRF